MAPVEWGPAPEAFAEAAGSDLSELLGQPVRVEAGALDSGDRDALLGAEAEHLVATLHSREDAPKPVFLVLARPLAAALAGARLGESVPEGGALPEPAQEAFDECAKLLGAALGRVLTGLGELPEVAHETSAFAAAGGGEEAGLPAGPHRRQLFRVGLEDGTAGELALWSPEDTASAWFGPGPGASAASGEGLPLAVVHPDAEVRNAAEDLGDALGRAVWTLDPAEFGSHSFDELCEAEAVIVAWDLGGISGLDLVESLRRDPRTAGRRVAIATEAPTRESVLAALRWGAATVLQLPLEAGEVKQRLGLS